MIRPPNRERPTPRATDAGKARPSPRGRRPSESVPSTRVTDAAGWLRGIHLSGFSLVMMVILLLAVVVLAPSLRTYAEQRQQINALRATVDSQQSTVDDLESERERWNDRTYVTTQARERLSYVRPGDISFLVINDLALPVAEGTETAPVSAKIQDTDVDWLDSMFASVMTAGLASAAPAPAAPGPVPAVPAPAEPAPEVKP